MSQYSYTLIVIIVYFSLFIIGHKLKDNLLPLWFVFILYFYKPFLSRVIIYFDGADSFVRYDLFSIVCSLLFPVTILIYSYLYSNRVFHVIKTNKIIFVFIMFCMMYFLQIANPMTSIARGIMNFKNVVFILYSVFFASILAITGNQDKKIFKVFSIIALSSITYGLFQGLAGFSDIDLALHRALLGDDSVKSLLLESSVRPIGFSVNNAHYYNLITLIMIYLYSQYKLVNGKLKALYWMLLFEYIIFMALFPERTQLAMFIIGVFVVKFIFSTKRLWYVLITGSSIIILIISVNFIYPNLSDSISNIRLKRVVELVNILNAETFKQRSAMSGPWKSAYNTIMDRPVIGFGSGTGISNRADGLYITSHNDLLSTWIELGIFGLMTLIFLIFIIFKRSIQKSKKVLYLKCLYAGSLGMLVPVLISGVFNVVLISGETSRIVWFAIGYAVVNGKIFENKIAQGFHITPIIALK
jgi:hypothetical protein